MRSKIKNLISLSLLATFSVANATDVTTDKIEVISSTPLPSIGVSLDKYPTNVQVSKGSDAIDQGATNISEFMGNNLGSVTVSNAVGNPYQPDVTYRGYSATSIQGNPTGLSVYLDGVRFNESFADTVNWDLIPQSAISSIVLMPGSNPLFGLNTLGGALSLTTKNGADNPGFSTSVLGGSYGRYQINLEQGWEDKARNMDYYVNVNKFREDGYRDHSSSDIQQLFAKARWHSIDGNNNLDISIALADNTASGTQALPGSMLGNPKSAYTWPDTIGNRLGMLNIKASSWLNKDTLLAGNAYYRKQDSNAVNSNAAFDDGCSQYISGSNTLSSPSGDHTGIIPNGAAAGNLSSNAKAVPKSCWAKFTNGSVIDTTDPGGSVNTTNVYSKTHQDSVGTGLQLSKDTNLLGHKDSFTLGASLDYSWIKFLQNTQQAQLVNFQTVNIPGTSDGSTGYSGLVDDTSLRVNKFTGSIFANNNFEVNDRFNFTAAARYDNTFMRLAGQSNTYSNVDGGLTWTDGDTSYYNALMLNTAGNALSTWGGNKWIQSSSVKKSTTTGLITAYPIAGAASIGGGQITRIQVASNSTLAPSVSTSGTEISVSALSTAYNSGNAWNGTVGVRTVGAGDAALIAGGMPVGTKYIQTSYSGTTNYFQVNTLTYNAGPETQPLNGDHHFARLNPSVGFNFKATEKLGLFGSYSEGMRTATPIELSCADPNNPCTLPTGFNGDPALKQVVAKTWDGGLRGLSLNDKVLWNVSAYVTNTANDIQFIAGSPTQGYFQNVGATRRQGVELNTYSKFDNFSLAANYGYVDATFQSRFNLNSPSNSSVDTNTGQITVNKGNKLPGVADQTLKLRAMYDLTPKWQIASNIIFQSGQYAHGDENNLDSHGKLPGYGVVNLDTHYKLTKEWTAFAMVNNLFDKDYSNFGLLGQNIYAQDSSNINEQFRTPANNRSGWVGVSYSFGTKKTNQTVDRD
jgi:outer membrane receptor protein involved in Fe transport